MARQNVIGMSSADGGVEHVSEQFAAIHRGLIWVFLGGLARSRRFRLLQISYFFSMSLAKNPEISGCCG
jgi:hypothetical protein